MKSEDLKIAVVGATGRMGTQVLNAVLKHENLELTSALTHSNSNFLGEDTSVVLNQAGLPSESLKLLISDDYSSLSQSQVVIDFAVVDEFQKRLKTYKRYGKPVVICTTGLTEQDMKALIEVSETLPIVYAANTSVGVNLLKHLVQQASGVLGMDADIEIIEAHHTKKKDAPSGTALLLGEAAANGRGQSLEQVKAVDRNGTDMIHEKGTIGFSSIRAGDIVGEHTVYLVTGGERLELTHRVASRTIFAEGAIKAAQWLYGKSAGKYSMEDVLGLDGKP